MAEDRHFHYQSLDELKQDIRRFGLADRLPLSEDFSVLAEPLTFANGVQVSNRFVVHPMEGFDADKNGTPGELAFRRYARYAHGGSGMIWFEACAVRHEARSNPCQFWLNDGNWEVFARLVSETKRLCREANGFEPVCVLQLTHSGRYSRPEGVAAPKIAHHNTFLDPIHKLPEDYPLVTDEYLDGLQESFEHSAVLAEKAGFDGVDVKGCHRYLMAELHASHLREGRYGGSLENRTRLMRESVARIRSSCRNLFVTTRLNACDELPYPFGFGMAKDGSMTEDLADTLQYVQWLRALGMPFINLSIANPYYQPHYGRPYDMPILNAPESPEHPLYGVARICGIIAQVQQANPDFPFVGTGFSWLRQFIPHVAAAALRAGHASMIGLGRSSFAYPDAPRDILRNGGMVPSKCCVACSRCTQIMRDGVHTGCIVRDGGVYADSYRFWRKNAMDPSRIPEFLERPSQHPGGQN